MYTDSHITTLLQNWSEGDEDALSHLLPLVYDDLHSMATFYFRGEGSAHTLQPTALVNEVYLRLFGETELSWENRRQFFAFAAKLMRHILVDHARSSRAQKRGSNAIHLPVEEVHHLAEDAPVDLVMLNEVLDQLAAIDPRQAEIVGLRFFLGLTVEEIAQVLDLSASTIKREWKLAKFWLHEKLASHPDQRRIVAG